MTLCIKLLVGLPIKILNEKFSLKLFIEFLAKFSVSRWLLFPGLNSNVFKEALFLHFKF